MKHLISKNEILFLDGNPLEVSVQCEEGILWITRAGDARDHIIKQGEIYRVKGKGKVAITGSRNSIISLSGERLMVKWVRPGNSARFKYLHKSRLKTKLGRPF